MTRAETTKKLSAELEKRVARLELTTREAGISGGALIARRAASTLAGLDAEVMDLHAAFAALEMLDAAMEEAVGLLSSTLSVSVAAGDVLHIAQLCAVRLERLSRGVSGVALLDEVIRRVMRGELTEFTVNSIEEPTDLTDGELWVAVRLHAQEAQLSLTQMLRVGREGALIVMPQALLGCLDESPSERHVIGPGRPDARFLEALEALAPGPDLTLEELVGVARALDA